MEAPVECRFVVNKTSNSSVELVGYTVVPACEAYLSFFPAVALLGPTAMLDASGAALFLPVDRIATDLPFKLPVGYGAIVRKHSAISALVQRPIFTENRSGNSVFMPAGLTTECLPGLQDGQCVEDNIVRLTVDQPGVYYWVVWEDGNVTTSDPPAPWPRDYGFVTGTVDAYTPYDRARLDGMRVFMSHGRLLHQACREPYSMPVAAMRRSPP
eukprot:364033-Chlamydomonas_euryale.AAC.19